MISSHQRACFDILVLQALALSPERAALRRQVFSSAKSLKGELISVVRILNAILDNGHPEYQVLHS